MEGRGAWRCDFGGDGRWVNVEASRRRTAWGAGRGMRERGVYLIRLWKGLKSPDGLPNNAVGSDGGCLDNEDEEHRVGGVDRGRGQYTVSGKVGSRGVSFPLYLSREQRRS